VFKARAEELDFPVGPFRGRIQENWADPALLRSRLEDLEKLSLSKIRSLGMTSYSFSPEIGLRLHGDRLVLDTKTIDREMATARRLGFLGLVGYDSVFSGENLCSSAERGSLLGTPARFRQVVDALEARAKEMNWLPLTLVVCDEPVGAGVTALLSRL